MGEKPSHADKPGSQPACWKPCSYGRLGRLADWLAILMYPRISSSLSLLLDRSHKLLHQSKFQLKLSCPKNCSICACAVVESYRSVWWIRGLSLLGWPAGLILDLCIHSAFDFFISNLHNDHTSLHVSHYSPKDVFKCLSESTFFFAKINNCGCGEVRRSLAQSVLFNFPDKAVRANDLFCSKWKKKKKKGKRSKQRERGIENLSHTFFSTTCMHAYMHVTE